MYKKYINKKLFFLAKLFLHRGLFNKLANTALNSLGNRQLTNPRVFAWRIHAEFDRTNRKREGTGNTEYNRPTDSA